MVMRDARATQPCCLVLRDYTFHHIVHHRARLSVRHRLDHFAVPAIDHDSADERGGVFG